MANLCFVLCNLTICVFFQMAGINCPPAAIAQSREDLEFKAIAQWEEMVSFQFHCKQMVDSIPKPPTLRGTLVALAAVADFLALTAESSTTDRATKGVAIAARAANRCLTELLDTAGLSGAPLAAKYCCQPGGNMEALTHLQQIQPTSAPGEDNMGDEDQPATGGLEMLLHLASVQHYAAKIINRSVRETPFAACSLSEDMMKDRADHKVVFDAFAKVPEVYAELFGGQRGDFKSMWAAHVNVAGRLTHPPRFEAQLPVFDDELWQGSVISGREILSKGAQVPDHPLPDAAALRYCFKSHGSESARGSKRSRTDVPDTYYLETDTVGALALLCGDLVYRFSLHLGDLLPELAPGPRMVITARQLPQRVLTLGIWFQLCINYQTFLLRANYTPYEVHELHHSFSYPVRDSPECRKLVTFVYAHQNLGPKRLDALPFLLTSRGLRGYHTFLADPDAYLAKINSPTGQFLDEISGIPSEARKRVAARKPQKTTAEHSAQISFTAPSGQSSNNQEVSFVSISERKKI